jgi:hypothetical protein
MDTLKTVAIKDGDSYIIINESDFDEKKGHQRYEGALPRDTVTGLSKNPDGTFSEPTPTDIRYPDKNKTEFANNHRSGMSAAEARKAAKLEDAPGGLAPDPVLAKQVKDGDEASKAAAKAEAAKFEEEQKAAAERSEDAKKPASKK